MRWTEFHAKAAGFAALNNDRNTSFCHEIPQRKSNDHSQVGLDYRVGPLQVGVTGITLPSEVEHQRFCGQLRLGRPLGPCLAGLGPLSLGQQASFERPQ